MISEMAFFVHCACVICKIFFIGEPVRSHESINLSNNFLTFGNGVKIFLINPRPSLIVEMSWNIAARSKTFALTKSSPDGKDTYKASIRTNHSLYSVQGVKFLGQFRSICSNVLISVKIEKSAINNLNFSGAISSRSSFIVLDPGSCSIATSMADDAEGKYFLTEVSAIVFLCPWISFVALIMEVITDACVAIFWEMVLKHSEAQSSTD